MYGGTDDPVFRPTKRLAALEHPDRHPSFSNVAHRADPVLAAYEIQGLGAITISARGVAIFTREQLFFD